MLCRILLPLTILTLTSVLLARAENWPQFRGPNANGLTKEKNLPNSWSSSTNIKWKVKIPGRGWSAPIVWEDKIFVTTAVPEGNPKFVKPPEGQSRKPPNIFYRWEIHCLDRSSGKPLWKRVALRAKPRTPIHKSNTYATETPVTDGKRIYAYFGMTGLFCYDFKGNLIWKKDLGAYPMWAGWGTSSGPALHKDLLFLQVDNEKSSFLVALDASTGKERWRKNRKGEVSNYATPIIWENSKRAELITAGLIFRSYDPTTGDLLWQLDMKGGRACASPVAVGDVLYIGTEDRTNSPYKRQGRGNGGFLFAVQAGTSGDITPSEGGTTNSGVLWTQPRSGPEMASPVVFEGFIYIPSRRSGIIRCHDAKTGKLIYRERLPGAGAFWSSPWAYSGKMFCLDAYGSTYVLKAGPKLEIIQRNDFGETCWAPTAIAGGNLFIRGAKHLYCIGR